MKHHEQLWQTMVAVIQLRAGHSSNTFLVHYTRIYVEAQVVAIRRLADTHSDALSLRKLLVDATKQPQILTRERYIASAENKEDWVAEDRARRFDHLVAPGHDHINPSIAAADLTKLDEATERVCEYVDKQVAHLDKRNLSRGETPDPVTFGMIHDAIVTIGVIVQHWSSLLRDVHAVLKPTIQGDWKSTFRHPLFAPPDEWGDPEWNDDDFDETSRLEL
jgi:hypothetical protein